VDIAGAMLWADLRTAEQTGLHPQLFDPSPAGYLLPARGASAYGYSVAFLVTTGSQFSGSSP
jgi:hypothetical protein